MLATMMAMLTTRVLLCKVLLLLVLLLLLCEQGVLGQPSWRLLHGLVLMLLLLGVATTTAVALLVSSTIVATTAPFLSPLSKAEEWAELALAGTAQR